MFKINGTVILRSSVLRFFLISVILFISYGVSAQDLEVKGRVLDQKNNPLPGVNILIKGTPNGTVAGPDGYFKITIPYGSHVLVYAFDGYKPFEQKVHISKDFPWCLEVTMASKNLKQKSSGKFIDCSLEWSK